MKALGAFYHGSLDGAFGTKAQEAFDALKAARDQEEHAPSVTQPSTPLLQRLMMNGAYTGIIDLSHGDSLDTTRLKSAGFAAIIHKASEGLSFKDPLYLSRKAAARAQGFLWGAYHFSSGDSGIRQAQNFLAAIGNGDENDLYVLDFEPSSHGPNMTLQQGRDWINAVHDATGRWPMVYGGGGLLRDLLEGRKDEVFARCPLWLCDIENVPPKTILPNWPHWTLCQYWAPELGGQEPKGVPGSDGADRNSFSGTEDQLRSYWPFH